VRRPSPMLPTNAIRSATWQRPKVCADKASEQVRALCTLLLTTAIGMTRTVSLLQQHWFGNLEVNSRAGKVYGIRSQQLDLI
jgi:hypothetical protein